MDKRAEHNLLEELVFVALNIVFFAMMLIFISRVGAGAFVTEQFYAKQIALLVDTAKPGTIIFLDVTDAYKLAEKNNFNKNSIVKVNGNKIIVKLSNFREYSFDFFNNVDIEFAPYRIIEEGEDRIVFLEIHIKENE